MKGTEVKGKIKVVISQKCDLQITCISIPWALDKMQNPGFPEVLTKSESTGQEIWGILRSLPCICSGYSWYEFALLLITVTDNLTKIGPARVCPS